MEYAFQKFILKQQKGNRRGRDQREAVRGNDGRGGLRVRHYPIQLTQENVEKAINSLKNRKAAGSDNITNEMLKYGGPMNQREITTFLKKVLYTRVTPQEWKTSIIIYILRRDRRKIQTTTGE